MSEERKLTPEEWGIRVMDVLARQPELATVTVHAMQAGIMEALDRRSERIAEVSAGLVEALNTKPHHVKRNHDVIVRAIRACVYHGSKWAKEMIAKEQPPE